MRMIRKFMNLVWLLILAIGLPYRANSRFSVEKRNAIAVNMMLICHIQCFSLKIESSSDYPLFVPKKIELDPISGTSTSSLLERVLMV